MRSRKFLMAVVLTVLATVAAAQDRMVIEGILVRVNDRIITISDFTKRLQVEIAQIPTAPTEEEIRQLTQTMLAEMVDEMVLLERAAEKNIEVNEKMVDQALQNLREENNLLEDEAWEAAVESSGLTMEQLRERYRRTIILQRAVQGEVRPLEITEEELRRLYEQQIEQYAVPEKVVLEQVFISDEGSSSGDTVRRADGIVARVRDGADLKAEATLAGSQLQDLGAIPVEDCRPELKAALANLEDGGVTDPLVVPGGAQIIRLDQTIPAGYQPFSEVSDDIRRRVSAETYEGQTRGLVEKLKKEYLVEVYEDRLAIVYRNLGGL
ncbi:MAG: peptidyl-prolyl cis-trans isomerase [Thermoanaerobaculales bacterium]|nr:peptidyl-prolyl cis-trans isomerase [Thermoanaerobaculales bacterium]